jgi:hypothetical protein
MCYTSTALYFNREWLKFRANWLYQKLKLTWSLSPKSVRNMVKLMGPGASFIIASRYSSVGS